MVNYGEGKIYKLWSPSTDKIYVGSTTKKYLSQRLSEHIQSLREYVSGKTTRWTTSFEILIRYDDVHIELLENYPCKTKDELRRKEGEYIRKLECVNRCIAGRTPKERYQDDKERILQRFKGYYEENKEKIQQIQRKWREENRERKREMDRKYREANKEKIKNNDREYYKRNSEKITCNCGALITKHNLKSHQKTLKHLNTISTE